MSKGTVAIIGAGIVGCAVAHEMSSSGFDVIVLEKMARIADATTSRNSGVIHAGIYYPPGSLKAMSCVRGQALLYEWCEKNNVAHRRTGKWIVAQATEEEELNAIYENAIASGATNLKLKSLSSDDIPGVLGTIAIYSANTGIVDPYDYSKSFMVRAIENGAHFLTDCELLGIEASASGYLIHSTSGELECDMVINCAGLYADEIAKMAGISKYRVYPWRGNYFSIRKRFDYKQLIYPVKPKNAPGLGVHLTLTLDGACKLGPDVEYLGSKDNFAEPENLEEKKHKFFTSASKFLKDLSIDDLSYDTCGIRPKLRSPDDKTEHDFIIAEDLPGFVNLIGIESPGLTAAIDLAQRVRSLLAGTKP